MKRYFLGAGWLVWTWLAVAQVPAADPRVRWLGFGETNAWHLSADAPWWSLVDLRDMLNLFHPFTISTTGAAAGATREVTLPADLRPPFALRFYCADDYFADPVRHKPGQLGTESFFAHRFKQVLVDGQVVWERDVIDENRMGSPTVFQVDLTEHVKPGQAFVLTFRVWDRVTTRERHTNDVWFRAGTWYAAGDSKVEQEPRFHTAVWFADAVVGEKATVEAQPSGQRPHEAVVRARHRARWPLPPRGERLAFPARLHVESAVSIPGPGFPLRGGVPLPVGVVSNLTALRIIDDQGRVWPTYWDPTATWPDGSLRWATLETILPAGTLPGAAVRLEYDPAAAPETVSVSRLSAETRLGRVDLDTGALRVRLGDATGAWIEAVTLAGQKTPVLSQVRPQLRLQWAGRSTEVEWSTERIDTEARSAVAVEVVREGHFGVPGQPLGKFSFRVRAFAGLPTLRTELRLFNEWKPEPYRGTLEDAPLEIADFKLVADVPGAGSTPSRVGIDGQIEVLGAEGKGRLEQIEAGRFRLTGTLKEGENLERAGHGDGWLSVPGDSGNVNLAVWRFWQQFPKSLACDGKHLEIGLFTAAPSAPFYRPRFGEAKRHDLWWSFTPPASTPEIARDLGQLTEVTPRLWARDWFCRSGSLSVLDDQWFESQPSLAEWVRTHYGDVSSERVTGKFGLRDFGDMPYGSQGQWLNGYWALMQGPLQWGLAAGDARWLERAAEIGRHLADVDTVHLPRSHADWVEWNGLTCALGLDHSVHNAAARWPAFQMGDALLLHHWISGDRDSRTAGLANADLLLRTRAGVGSSEARSQARPLLTLLRAWQATGEAKYLEGARRYFDLPFQTAQVLDWRRGAYIQPTYENWRCISAGLDSMYAHNLYEFYRLTGDVDAAQVVVAVADSVYAESMLPQEEGLGSFLFYVRYDRGSWYYTQMAMLFYMAYDLTEDLRFLRAGRAAFERYLRCKNREGAPQYQPVHNFGWLDPEFGGWRREFRAIPTAPFRIQAQTPVPDPAQYAP